MDIRGTFMEWDYDENIKRSSEEEDDDDGIGLEALNRFFEEEQKKFFLNMFRERKYRCSFHPKPKANID